ncbi:hypothetical protein PB01_04590 [Psychrobacillus glaciei]|uniref:WD40 repeat domain-containing protein n=1 Tax=Psychrobacillus glaciei TaxID=2283160 RepID=A0A5J6SMZ8_9BACI|nr:hypothetical protein [Psychrobacillus glaciei]QFF98154.1 hypothetical protein PB01_04590 [Psychrobacillus glaciei]
MKKVYIPVIVAMLLTPIGSIANAEELVLPKNENSNSEEIVEVDRNIEEWLEDVVEAEPEEKVNLEGHENLGPVIFKTSAITSKIAANIKGDYFIYYIMHGSPTALVVVDYQTKEIVHSFTLEDSKSAWGLDVDKNGKLWVGGSVSSVLYSYDPNTEVFEKHGAIFSNKSDTSIQDLIVEGNKVYVGSAYGGSLASYDTITKKIEEFGQIRKRREFVKAIAADEKTDEIFVSIGSPMDLLVKKPKTKNFTSFLPAKYMSEKYAQDLILTDKYLVARLHPSNKAVVFDRKTLKIVDEFDLNSKTLSKLSPDGKSLYYTKEQQLIKYDFSTKEHTELGLFLPKGTEAINLDFVMKNTKAIEEGKKDKEELKENTSVVTHNDKSILDIVNSPLHHSTIPILEESKEEESKEWVLSGMVDNLGQLFEYNPQTQEMNYLKFDLPEQPVELYTLASSSDGTKIFANGYMSGGLATYDVATGNRELYRNVSQIETMFDINNKLYIGAYPLARLLVYDRSLPWNTDNPNEVIRMSQYGQERTTAVTPFNDGKEIIFGTLPDASVGGGDLAFYDTITKKIDVYEDYIYNQSIVSLVSRGSQVFGGTSIHANQQVNPRGARFFYFNRRNPEDKTYINLPFDSSMITSLIVDSNKKIWGMADGKLFVYTDEGTEVRSVELLPLISGRFRNAQIVDSDDGYIFGSVEGKLFRVSKDNLTVEWLKDKGVYGLAKDVNGDLYYNDGGSNLWKYTIEKNRKKKQ